MHVVPEVVQDSQCSLAGSAKFTAAYRLLREDGFGHVFNAEKIGNDQLKIFFVGNNKENARLGIVASKKILPGSVARNRIKRIIREAFRQHSLKQIKMDMVVMVRRANVNEMSALGGNLKTLFSRVESRCARS